MIQGSDWTILLEAPVFSSTDDDVITMETLGGCSVQQGNIVKSKPQMREDGGSFRNCHTACSIPELTPAVGGWTSQKAPPTRAGVGLKSF